MCSIGLAENSGRKWPSRSRTGHPCISQKVVRQGQSQYWAREHWPAQGSLIKIIF